MIFFRPNPDITFLKNAGYNVVSLPRADLKPNNTLLRTSNKELTFLGNLGTIVEGANPLPQISTDNIAPSGVTGMQSSSLDLKVGLSILGNVLKALTGTSLDVNAGFKDTKSVTFEYKDVLEDHIVLDELDQLLSASTFKQNLNMVRSALIESNVFILTSAIKSKSITVKTQGEGGVSGNIEVPVIQNIASGKLSVDFNQASQGQVTFTGTTPVVFGFKAVQVFTDENAKYTIFKPTSSGAVVIRKAADITDEDLALLSSNSQEVFLDIQEAQQPAAREAGAAR